MALSTPLTTTIFDYRTASNSILKTLKRARDRQIIARRFGFDLPARQTLEQIGRSFGITRERVRQIEKTTLTKLAQQELPEAAKANDLIRQRLEGVGGIAPTAVIAASLSKLGEGLEPMPEGALENIASIAKQLAHHETQWGLVGWPEVNPKSIRDKTYLVLGKHGQPMHFSQISEHIKNSNFARRNVTVQAVHNELIKDPRFILIGRGIYALAEWGYTPGTVADIIIDVLREEAPLHKDEIVKRVLKRRQVKTTTIILNLQEKDHFVRVAKATYKLKDQ